MLLEMLCYLLGAIDVHLCCQVSCQVFVWSVFLIDIHLTNSIISDYNVSDITFIRLMKFSAFVECVLKSRM